jgi:hypothetical protein
MMSPGFRCFAAAAQAAHVPYVQLVPGVPADYRQGPCRGCFPNTLGLKLSLVNGNMKIHIF